MIWIKRIGLVILTLLVIVFLVFGTGLLCCKSFEPIWIKDLPPECNMSLNAVKMYYDSKDKSGAAPVIDYCYKCLHRIRCQAEVYGYSQGGQLNPVDYSDAKKYRDYEQCRSELK